MRRARGFSFFTCIAAAFLLGCAEPKTERAAEIFGTQITITVLDMSEKKAAAAIGEVFAHFAEMDKRFHAWRPGELAEINRALAKNKLPLTVGAEMAAMISLSAASAKKSEGLFNPAAGGLFRLWGFHADSPPNKPPPPEAIAAYLRAAPDMRDIKLRGRVLFFAPKNTMFDFGAVAKGAALDAAKKILQKRGAKNALINVGGNIMALGKNGGRHWRIALNLGKVKKIIELKDGEAAATSGGAERFFVYERKRYQHIIDTRTGAPAENIFAASAISNDLENAGAMSDAAATSMVIADKEAAKRIAKNFNLSAAARADAEGNISVLAGAERLR
ncbi:MAG: FAD:protein FMN transferase [Betaproteobacteria bacterium]|nr:FAD:protein FMN transferase [Betaproteobacteria bacterium]